MILDVVPEVVATAVLPLVQVPPLTALLKVVVAFWQNEVTPVIADGTLTVTVYVVLPHWLVAVITDEPEPTLPHTPVTGSMVATKVLLLLHVPVGTPSLLSVVVTPMHKELVPDITIGAVNAV